MSVYETSNEIFRGSGPRYRFEAPTAHLVMLLGMRTESGFAGRLDGDEIVVWLESAASAIPVWCVWANSVEAWRRFQRQLTRAAHPDARLLERPYAPPPLDGPIISPQHRISH